MSEPVRKQDLIAYADGELPARRHAEVEAYLRSHPAMSAEVKALRMMRKKSRAVLRESADKAPSELRNRISEMVMADAQPEVIAISRSRGSWPIRRLAIAASLVLLASAAAMVYWQSGQAEPGAIPIVKSQQMPQTTLVQAAVQKHLACSQFEDHFYDPQFPRTLAELAPAARAFLDASIPTPDLSAIGYKFDGAGKCRFSNIKTLHLLYESTAPPHRHVSLFVQPFQGQVDFAEGKAVLLEGPTASHPVLAWRGKELLFLLIADDFGSTSQSAAAFGQTVESPVTP